MGTLRIVWPGGRRIRVLPVSSNGDRVVYHYVQRGSSAYVDIDLESVGMLMEQLLRGALNDYLGYREASEHHLNAREWLYGEDGAWDVMSFNSVCGVLGLDRDRVRFNLNALADQGKTDFKTLEFIRFFESCRR